MIQFSFVGIISALRRNEFVAMLVDRPYANSGIRVKLFGHDTLFSSAPALIHQHTEAAVLPAFVLQTVTGRYVSRIEPPVEMTRDPAASAANTQRIATAFEPVIREHPEQWYNFTRIWTAAETSPFQN